MRAPARAPLSIAALALLVALLSYGAAWLGHAIVLSKQGVSVLWPANAFLVSVLLLVPRRTWPVLIPAGLAGFIAHDLQFGFAPGTIALLNLADTIEILIVCIGLGYVFDGVPRLTSWKALAKYGAFAVLLGPFVSAFVVAHAIPGSYLANFRMWFFSQTLAFLTVTPAILSWAAAWRERGPGSLVRRRAEAAAFVATLAGLGYVLLLAPSWMTPMPEPMLSTLIYAFVPLLLWAALRFGAPGVSTSMIVICFFAIWGAIHGHGPFAGPVPSDHVLALQLFLMFAAIPFMALAVLAEERARHVTALSGVSRKLIEAHEDERRWIARELHDDLNQRVAMVYMNLDALERELRGAAAQARTSAGAIKDDLRTLGHDIHALSHRLHSSKLEYVGLASACAGFCRELSERHDVEIAFEPDGVPAALSPELSLCLFRVLQEALRNAVKHSGVRTFQVSLARAPGGIELRVRDAGTGFDPDAALAGRGLGLTSMQERLKLVDGRLSIDSAPGHGTTIRAWAAIPADRASTNG